jgi:hypothetical protein
MYISETKLRKIIRSELINEGYTPEILFEPILFGYEKKSAVNAEFLGGDSKTGIYVLIQGKKPSGYSPVRNKSDSLNDMLKKVKQTERGKSINKNGINKLKVALRDGKIYFSSGNKLVHEIVNDAPSTLEYADLIYDIMADSAGSILSIFPPTLGASTAINSSQAIKKWAQEKWTDGTISALSAFPIPAGAAGIKPGLTLLTKLKAFAKQGAKALSKNLANISSITKGLSDFMNALQEHKKAFLTFVKNDIFSLSKGSLPSNAINKISESVDAIIKSILELVDELK